jgi:hypothetical protein
MRRACNSEQTSPLPSRGPGDLSAALVQFRDRIDRQLGHDRSSPLLPPGWSGVLGAALRRPSVIVWLLLMVPSVMWFVIGGLPQTAALQTTMTAPVAWKAVVVLGLIRFRGHLPKGGYDVPTDGRDPQTPAAPAIR